MDDSRLPPAYVVPAARQVELQRLEEDEMNRMPFPRILAIAALAMQAAAPQFAADVVHLTLTDAVHMAISQNRALRIARLKAAEMGHRKAEEHAVITENSGRTLK